ncbi:MAG: T9SS type A sorting domain-containing protein [Chitinispirillaceae bacterium]|nr:T9SS type A sorting domain-containing protein [Chitinispirillaceae bacterium]
MRLHHCLVLTLPLFQPVFPSATGTLKGVVKERSTGTPIPGAIVRLIEKGITDTTDADGAFLFSSFPVSIVANGVSSGGIMQPRYIPGKGITFVNKTAGHVRVAVFNLSGTSIALLANSMLERGIWSLPLKVCTNGLYLCRITSANKSSASRFVINETIRRHGKPAKTDDLAGIRTAYSPNAFAATPAVDSVITSKSGYVSDTTLWTEKISDSIDILLSETGGTEPQNTVRTVTPFDKEWLFYKGDASGADKPGFADASWRSLDVPHDWSIEGPFDENAPTTGYGGYLPAGIGWYRKHFTLPADLSGRRIFIEFDGVMANSTVYMNGTSLGTRPFGYTSFQYEITDHANFDATENVMAVKVDNSVQPASRWYTGAGIYSHVRLIATNPIHIDHWATFVTTPAVTTAQATVHVQTTAVNQGSAAQSVTVRAIIVDPAGTRLAPVTSTAKNIPTGGTADFTIEIPVVNPRLWSIETPDLYQAVTAVEAGDDVLDDEVTFFGIRTIKYDPENGFLLNGKSVKHKGVCLHHDLSALGAAMHQRAMQRRLAVLKTLGVNAIRTAHNPVAPQVLDLCDRMGFLVMDEFFDVWKSHKYNMPGDYAAYFNKWYTIDAADIVKRDRNHPSVVLYSIGNEIRDALSTRTPIATDLVEICHTNDPTRPVTQALFRPSQSGDYPGAMLNILDVFGVNYRTAELLEAITGSNHTGVITEIAANPSDWSGFVMAHDKVVGEYLWTGADYLGECNDGWPRVGAPCGLIDRVGTIKDIGYQYQAIWSSNAVARPKTSTAAPAKVLLSVDHPTITVDIDDVAYVKASIVDASGVTVGNASTTVTFTVSGSSGKIIALDSGTSNGESFRGDSRNAYKGVCFAIVRMTAPGSVTISASADGLAGSSVTVTGVDGPFVPCSGSCD